ncbi:MAG: histidinol-phosphate transaminase [Cellvibrionales bacterium]|nr:histidinol-phosphate transaminase [Cellvibrionales bacterium]
MSCDFTALAKSGIQTLKPYVPGKPEAELARELGISDIVKLASNENPLGISPKALEAIQAEQINLTRYPDGSHFLLQQKLAAHLDIKANQLVFGNGSNDVLDLIGHCFLTPDVSAVFSEHAFIVYPLMVKAQGAEAIVVPAKDYGHDLDAMANAIKPNTRIIFVANPNNPTGTYHSIDAIEAFLSRVREDVLVVLDEAYIEYQPEAISKQSIELLARYSNLIITRTFSKAYGLAGLRVGYGIASESIIGVMQKARAPFNVNSLAQAAAIAVLDDADYLRRTIACNQQGMQQLSDGLLALGFSIIPSKGNFITFDTGTDAMSVYQALLHEGVILRPVGVYGLPNHLRVTIGTDEENTRFLDALKKVTKEKVVKD